MYFDYIQYIVRVCRIEDVYIHILTSILTKKIRNGIDNTEQKSAQIKLSLVNIK